MTVRSFPAQTSATMTPEMSIIAVAVAAPSASDVSTGTAAASTFSIGIDPIGTPASEGAELLCAPDCCHPLVLAPSTSASASARCVSSRSFAQQQRFPSRSVLFRAERSCRRNEARANANASPCSSSTNKNLALALVSSRGGASGGKTSPEQSRSDGGAALPSAAVASAGHAHPSRSISNSGGRRLGRGATSKAEARLCLCAVAFLYGTLNVALKQIYSTDDAPNAAAVSCIRGWMVALCFVPALLSSWWSMLQSMAPKSDSEKLSGVSNDQGTNTPESGSETPCRTRPSPHLPLPLWLSALELAVYNCASFALLNLGIVLGESTTRASFLTQTSVVITPLLSVLAGQVVDHGVWAGCAVALAGLAVLSMAQHGHQRGEEHYDMVADMAGEVVPEPHPHPSSWEDAPSSPSFGLSPSDLLVLGGAACWSLYLVRASAVASMYDKVRLQGTQNAMKAGLYTIWAAIEVAASASAGPRTTVGEGEDGSGWSWAESLRMLWPGWRSSPWPWMLLVFSAVGPGALAGVLQQMGQGGVSAGEASVLLSAEPAFTVLCAWAVLGEVTTARESWGGGMIAVAALLASGSLDGMIGRRWWRQTTRTVER